MTQKYKGTSTRCVHAGVHPDEKHGALMTPIFQTSTFLQDYPGKPRTYDYSRGGNPTREALEESLAAIEGAKYSISFSSGLAAAQAVLQTLKPGAHVVVCDDVYGGTGRLFRKLFAKYDITFDFINMTEIENVEKAVNEKTKLVWVETPTNPLLKIIDIEAVANIAKKVGATTVVDNTFASPIFQTPLELGADIILHSTTKYIGGHSDLVGGALMLNDDTLFEELKFIQFAAGAVNSPTECFYLLRSIKTLSLRMKKHQENALAFAQALEKLDVFSEVIYPGLESHPQHALAKKQMNGFSGIVSARLKGSFDDVVKFMQSLNVIALAESLGGVESLANHPETMTHASVPPDHRKVIGITHDLIRFSIGIEDASDLIDDVNQAAKAVLK